MPALLTNRRLLLVLDNAASAVQVRQLLPAEAGCAVLVTSRNELRGLTALQGARRVALEPLSDTDARALLVEIAGDELLTADPETSAELVRLCGRLPLALRIAAANLFSRGGIRLAEYVEELRDANRLSALSIEDDDQAAVRTALGPPPCQRPSCSGLLASVQRGSCHEGLASRSPSSMRTPTRNATPNSTGEYPPLVLCSWPSRRILGFRARMAPRSRAWP